MSKFQFFQKMEKNSKLKKYNLIFEILVPKSYIIISKFKTFPIVKEL